MDEQSLFLKALDQESPERAFAWLQEACGANEQVRNRVEQLLKKHFEANSFLERSATEFEATCLHADGEAVAAGHVSILRSIGRRFGEIHSVALHAAEEELEDPVVRANSSQGPSMDPRGRYQFLGEIARGGMGAIIKGRDTDLGRDLAAKVLLEEHMEKPDIVQRFVEEAQISGQLQHPGIAPIYELGQFADQRPFFTMKLVKGSTLASLLSKRRDPGDDLQKLLDVFEHVCQTMAYAHSRKVIHRDLKPANIMVGAFGEVQVMDWGLAKVLHHGGVADERKAAGQHDNISIIETLRHSGSQTFNDDGAAVGSQTRAGSVMGTPAYMPPEQALGQAEQVDERSDVFGLGAILCEILTGRPPYVGENGHEVLRKAIRADQTECFQRLEKSQSHQALKQLVQECLVADPKKRPQDAGVVSERVTEHLQSIAWQLRQAELRRKITYVVAASLLLLVAGLGVGAVWAQAQKTEVAQQVANEERKHAAVQKAANEELQQLLYASEIQLASSELGIGNVQNAARILASHVPEVGEMDRRGFEWHYLDRLCLLPKETGRVRNDWAAIRWNYGSPRSSWNQQGSRVAMHELIQKKEDQKQGGQFRWRLTVIEVETEKTIWTKEVTRPAEKTQWMSRFELSRDGKKACFTVFPLGRVTQTRPLQFDVWDIESGQHDMLTVPAVKRSYDWINWRFTRDGRRMVALYHDNQTSKLKLSASKIDHDAPLYSIDTEFDQQDSPSAYQNGFALSPDGKKCLNANILKIDSRHGLESKQFSMEVRDSATGEVLHSLPLPLGHECGAAEFSPDGNAFAVICINKSVSDFPRKNSLWICDTHSGELLATIPTVASSQTRLGFSPDSRVICLWGTGELFDTRTSANLGTLAQMRDTRFRSVRFHSDQNVVTGIAEDGRVLSWELPDLREVLPSDADFESVSAPLNGTVCVGISGEGKADFRMKTFLIRSLDGQVNKYKLPKDHFALTNGASSRLSSDGTVLSHLAFAKWLDASRQGLTQILWNVDTGERLGEPAGMNADEELFQLYPVPHSSMMVGAPAVRDEKRYLVSTRIAGWITPSLEEHVSFEIETGLFVSAMAVSDDGKLLAAEIQPYSGYQGRRRSSTETIRSTLQIFSLSNGKKLQQLTINSSHNFRFSPDGREIALVNPTERSLDIWEIATGTKRISLDLSDNEIEFTWSAIGDRIIGFSRQAGPTALGQLRIWETRNGRTLLVREEQGAAIKGLEVLPDGNRVVGWGNDLIPYIWDATPQPR